MAGVVVEAVNVAARNAQRLSRPHVDLLAVHRPGQHAVDPVLGSLEDLGYIVRSDARDEGRARIVRFTKRGHAAYAKALEVLSDIEREWSAELGPKDFAQLKELLCRVWESLLIR